MWLTSFLEPPLDPYHKPAFLSQSIEPIFTGFTKSFNVVTSDLCLGCFVPQGDYMLYCEHGIKLVSTRILFAKLCCASMCLNKLLTPESELTLAPETVELNGILDSHRSVSLLSVMISRGPAPA